MGYLNNQVVTVDAILTKKGRELLAQGGNAFNITQFSLSDDEVDYSLYNPNHPSGSAYYGEAIENMPVLEAFPNELQTMKYKLVTLPRSTAVMPTLTVGTNVIQLVTGESQLISPQTQTFEGTNAESNGYTATFSNITYANIIGAGAASNNTLNAQQTLGTNVSKTVLGTSINLVATSINTLFGSTTSLNTTITVIGRGSGARLTIPVTITKTN